MTKRRYLHCNRPTIVDVYLVEDFIYHFTSHLFIKHLLFEAHISSVSVIKISNRLNSHDPSSKLALNTYLPSLS